MNPDFFMCKHCGNTAYLIGSSGAKMVCCGEEMQALKTEQATGAAEKHRPKIKRDGNILSAEVGEILHPMQDAHYIMWVAVLQQGKVKINVLKPNEPPIATFRVNPYADAAVYEYCNQHGLWETESKGKPRE